jgi:hypothetical protein
MRKKMTGGVTRTLTGHREFALKLLRQDAGIEKGRGSG